MDAIANKWEKKISSSLVDGLKEPQVNHSSKSDDDIVKQEENTNQLTSFHKIDDSRVYQDESTEDNQFSVFKESTFGNLISDEKNQNTYQEEEKQDDFLNVDIILDDKLNLKEDNSVVDTSDKENVIGGSIKINKGSGYITKNKANPAVIFAIDEQVNASMEVDDYCSNSSAPTPIFNNSLNTDNNNGLTNASKHY